MTTPRSVHSMGCATYMRSMSSPNPIVAKVKKETRKHRTGPGPGEGEDDTDESEQADEAPGITQLGCVHQSKERARHQDAGGHAGANSARGFHPERLENRGSNARQDRIQVAAKNRFLHEGCDKYSHGHER